MTVTVTATSRGVVVSAASGNDRQAEPLPGSWHLPESTLFLAEAKVVLAALGLLRSDVDLILAFYRQSSSRYSAGGLVAIFELDVQQIQEGGLQDLLANARRVLVPQLPMCGLDRNRRCRVGRKVTLRGRTRGCAAG